MILNLPNGLRIDLAASAALRAHHDNPRCFFPVIVGQLNEGLYDGQPMGGTVLDLGANCGLFSAYAACRCERVIAVEPSVRHFAALTRFIAEAGLNHVQCLNAAVWDHDGATAILEDDGNFTMDRIDFDGLQPRTADIIPCRTLLTLLDDFGIDRASFVKMDIEGAEEDVLSAPSAVAAAARIETLWVECHNFKHWDNLAACSDRIERLVRGLFPQVTRYNETTVIGHRF